MSSGHLPVFVGEEANRSRPSRPISSPTEYVRWFTELIEGLGVPRMALAGNSRGGSGAAYCATNLGDRVERLVLISPAATLHPIVPSYTHMVPKPRTCSSSGCPGWAR